MQPTGFGSFQRSNIHRRSLNVNAISSDTFACYRCGRNGHIAINCMANMSMRRQQNPMVYGNNANYSQPRPGMRNVYSRDVYPSPPFHMYNGQRHLPPIFCISCRDNSHCTRECPYLNRMGKGPGAMHSPDSHLPVLPTCTLNHAFI